MRLAPLPCILLALAFGAVLLGMAAMRRDPEYDEGYTAFVTSAVPRPNWPQGPFRVRDARAAFRPAPTPWGIADALRRTDVHPPLYFWTVWAWRRLWGPDLVVSRLLSVGFSLGALACLAAVAAAAEMPILPGLALTLGCYGFVGTGIVARGFAMAQCLLLLGLLLTLRTAPAAGPGTGPGTGPGSRLAAGAALGAASFTNYLAAFPAAATILWFARQQRRQQRGWSGVLAMLSGFLPFILGDLFFFAAQRNSRVGQFAVFTWARFAGATAHALGGAVLGGLPLYLPAGLPRRLATALLGLVLIAILLLPALRWRRIGPPQPRLLLALAALATPAGLLLMAVAAHSVPVEIRYFAFALPPLALLLAASLASLPRRWGQATLGTLLAIQALSIAGLMTQAQTMQPEGTAARAAWRVVGDRGIVLLPRGNDGVGIVSAFLTAAPDGLHVMLVAPDTHLGILRRIIATWPGATVAKLGVDEASRRTIPLMAEALKSETQMR